MNIAEFQSAIAAHNESTGKRPRLVLLGQKAINGIQMELGSMEAAHSMGMSVSMSAAPPARDRPGYCMTLFGVDVHREPDLRGDEFHVAVEA